MCRLGTRYKEKDMWGGPARILENTHPNKQATTHPAESSWIFTTTGRILFYNSWKETFGKLQIHCSEFKSQQWLSLSSVFICKENW
jgi:hypothetical protein